MNLSKNIFWNAIGNIFYLGVQWLITVLVTRKSGLEDAGVLSLAMSISATFQPIAFWGMRNYQISDIENKYDDNCYIQSRIVTCSLSFSLCCLFIIFNRYSRQKVLAILCFLFFRLSEGFSDVLHGISQKNGRLDLAGKGFALKGLVVVMAFFIGYFLFGKLATGLSLMATGAFYVTFLYDFTSSKQFLVTNYQLQKKDIFGLLKEMLPLCICVFLQSAILTSPKFILEKICGEIALGAYSSIFAPATIIHAATGYIFTPFIGYFSQYYQNQNFKKFKKLFAQILFYITLIALFTVFCAQVFGKKILNYIFGSIVLGYEYLLNPIVFAVFITAILGFVCMLSVVIRDFLSQIIACTLGLLICILSTVICIKLFGINGASYGVIIGGCFSCLFLIKKVTKSLEVNSKK